VAANPFVLALNPVTNRIYVTYQTGNFVTVLDGATHAIVDVPGVVLPLGMAVDTLRNKIYIADTGGGQVAILDGQTNTLITNQGSISDVHAVAMNPLTNEFYAMGNASGLLTVVAAPPASLPIGLLELIGQ
jgi:DNA-binding beta-propeller fold protein YncE